jgi:aerotaxis receptor
MFKKYLMETGGNVAMMFGVCSTVLLIGIGSAIDYSGASKRAGDLQNYVDAAVLAAARSGKETADECVTDAQSSKDVVDKIYQMVSDIADLSTQISVASEQQNTVSQEISRNIQNVNQASQQNLKQAELVEQQAELIEQRSKTLSGLGKTFG